MTNKKNIFVISGSTRRESNNIKIIRAIERLYSDRLHFTVYESIAHLPHFNPDLDNENPPAEVKKFREQIQSADGVLLCTPEYVFSLPGSLKNALEWMVSTIIFTDKPTATITAASGGEKAFESLSLILKTIGAKMNEKTQILIQTPKIKLSNEGEITDTTTLLKVQELMEAFMQMLE